MLLCGHTLEDKNCLGPRFRVTELLILVPFAQSTQCSTSRTTDQRGVTASLRLPSIQ